MPKTNEIPRFAKTVQLDKGIPELIEKLAAQKNLDRINKKEGPKVHQVELYNGFIRRGLIEAGMIKKGDPLWLD